MARPALAFVCQKCGTVHAKLYGQCNGCGEWNTLVEEAAAPPSGTNARRATKGRPFALEGLSSKAAEPPRRDTGVAEFDRVAGGGLVPGSALLLGGDPGVGKSTLVLQALGAYARKGKSAVYVSGEEALGQVRLRASRMGLVKAPVQLGAATCVEDILATLASAPSPDILVIDSIQTVWTSALDAAPGTIAQVRTATHDLVRYAKAAEHLVDAVLYFEGERGHHFRILRAVKNRFGATDEIGVFEMTGTGLSEVPNPSALFLGDRSGLAPGAAVFAGMEGTRPLLSEIQALTALSGYGTPRRAVVGWDAGRLSMILAVLDARAGLGISSQDVYLNVAGGLKITEPAADLAAAAALVSSFSGRPLPRDSVVFGEIALSGDVRPSPHADARLKEAAKLGFARAFVPAGTKLQGAALTLAPVDDVADLVRLLAG